MRKILILHFITFISLTAFSQINTQDSLYILSGTVVNGNNNVLLEGTHLTSSKGIGTYTNPQGGFSLNIKCGDTIKISHIGFKTLEYIAPYNTPGQYLIKFKLYADSISLDEIAVFPYPTYKEFKEAFSQMDKQDEQIEIKGVKTYVDKKTTPYTPTVFNPVSFIYDRLFDKQTKLKRKLDKRRKSINESIDISE